MKKLAYKLTTGLATVSLVATLFAPAAFASGNTISGNGVDSTNNISTFVSKECLITQNSKTLVDTTATVKSSTGGNNANSNTGGDVTIDTGKASSSLTIAVNGGSNTAHNPCCPCQDPVVLDNAITGNGQSSLNGIGTVDVSSTSVTQKTKTRVRTTATVKSRTGKNNANGNTGGGIVLVTTDTATSTMSVGVNGGSNTL